MTQQTALPLAWPERYGLDDFVVAECNALALMLMKEPQEWKTPLLVLQGEPKSGKSHLASIFQELHHTVRVTNKDNIQDAIQSDISMAVMDDADFFLKREKDAPVQLFHLINHILHKKGRLLLTGTSPPSLWTQMPELASRVQAGQTITLDQPSEDMIKAAYQKMFLDRGLLVDEKVLDYLAVRSERSFSGIRTVVDQLDVLALEQSRRITIPLIQSAGILS